MGWLSTFCLWEIMLAVHKGVSVLHVPGNRFKEDLLHFLLRIKNKADWPVGPWIFLLAFFPQLPRSSLGHYDLSKVIGRDLAVASAKSLSTIRSILSGPMDLCMSILLKYFITNFVFIYLTSFPRPLTLSPMSMPGQ